MKTLPQSHAPHLESSLDFLRKKSERSSKILDSLPQEDLKDRQLLDLRKLISGNEAKRLELCERYLAHHNSMNEQLGIFEQFQPKEESYDPSFFKAVTISQNDFDELRALKEKLEPFKKVELLENMFLALEGAKPYLDDKNFMVLQESLQECVNSLDPEKAQSSESSTDDPFQVFQDQFNKFKKDKVASLEIDVKKKEGAISQNKKVIGEKKQQAEDTEKRENTTFGNRFRKFFGLKVKITKSSQELITKLKEDISVLEGENKEISEKQLPELSRKQSHLGSLAIDTGIKSEAVSRVTDSCQPILDRNNGALQKFFSSKEKFLEQQEKQEQRMSEAKESFSEAFKERVNMFIYRAKLVQAGEVKMADTKTQKVLSAASSAAELSPIPYVNTAINFLSTCFGKYTESKTEKKIANTLDVSKTPGFDEFMGKFMDKFMQNFSKSSEFKKLESLCKDGKQDFDQQAVELAKRIMKGIYKAKVEVGEKIKEGKIDEAVEEAIEYVLKPKKETRDFSKQAIIVLDKGGNSVVLCEESRFATDSKQGFHKYGIRPATDEEQQSFTQSGSLKGYKTFTTREELLTEAIKEKVNTKVFAEVSEYVSKFKENEDSKLPTADDLKEFLEGLEKDGLKKGKRNAFNAADKDREKFNEVKDLLSSLVGNIHENRSFKDQQKEDRDFVKELGKELVEELKKQRTASSGPSTQPYSR